MNALAMMEKVAIAKQMKNKCPIIEVSTEYETESEYKECERCKTEDDSRN